MTTCSICPSLDAPIATMEQVCSALARPRSTVATWITKYDWLDAPPVKAGSARKLSLRNIALFALVRQAVLVSSVVLDATRDALDLLHPHIEALHGQLECGAFHDEENRPHLPVSDAPAYLIGHEYFGSTFMLSIGNQPTESTCSSLLDLAGFPVPTIILPLDQTIRNAWNRTLGAVSGIELND